MNNRRAFLVQSARLVGGAAILGPLIAACGSDDESTSTTTPDTAATSGTAASAATTGDAEAPTSEATEASEDAPPSLGTVRTAFNWVPDVEWSAWYLAQSNGLFARYGANAEFLHGGPNTPAVAQVVAAGEADFGVASDELQLIKANAEGADFVILGAMYGKSPNGYCWLADTPITDAASLVGKRIGLTTGDEIRVDAIFKLNDLEPDYEPVPMSFDPQPLVDGDVDVITCYVTNQPIQFQLRGVEAKSLPFTDFGLKAYGDVLFASRAYVEANRELVVAYLAGLLAGVEANVADPTAVIPLLTDVYGKDAEIDPVYSEAGNPAYIALLDTANPLAVDPAYLEQEVYPSYEASGETDLPPVSELLDATLLEEARAL